MRDRRVTMTEYDPVKCRANIAFIDSKGRNVSIWIHENTFRALMEGPWDADKMGGQPSSLQEELREALRNDIKKGFVEWFAETANEIMKGKVLSRNRDENKDAK